jgi:hypothetical protein
VRYPGLAAALLVALVASPASGKVISRTDLGTFGEYRGWFIYAEKKDDPVEVAPLRAKRTWRCSRAKVSLLFESDIFNANLWRYSMRQGRCWNGRRITSLYHFKRWSEYTNWNWSFEGHVDFAKSGGVGHRSAYKMTQGKYQLCYPLWCEKHYPTLELRVRRDGSVSRDKAVN